MKVLHIIPSMDESNGGPAVAICRMISALCESGVVPTLATTNERSVPTSREDVLNRLDPRATVHLFPTFPSWNASVSRNLCPQMLFWMARNIRNYDVVHVHAIFTGQSLIASRACARAGVPFILRPAGSLGSWSLEHKAWKKAPYYKLVERRHLETCAAVHVTSRFEADAVAELGYRERTACIPIGMKIPNEPERRAVPGRALQVLSMSRLHPVKNLITLIRGMAAASANPPAELTIAGGGDESYRLELAREIRRIGLEQRVRFAGFVSGAPKERLMIEADVFALPSHHENFGVAVAEAMSYGLPVVISDQVGLAPDVRAAGAGEVVGAKDAAGIGLALDRLSDPEVRARVGAAGRRLIQAEFSMETMAGRLNELYTRVARTARGAPSPNGSSIREVRLD